VTFARWVFRIAGVYGLLILTPIYFLEERIGRDQPPPITHPEYFYGFIGVAIAWQVAFLVISRDPVRYRLMMVPAIIEKGSYVIALVALFSAGRIPPLALGYSVGDFIFGVLFIVAFLRTGPIERRPGPSVQSS
jgi:hypothetical protein